MHEVSTKIDLAIETAYGILYDKKTMYNKIIITNNL